MQIRNKIADIYEVDKNFILASWLRCLSELRNFCAHHSRVYNRIFPAFPHAPNPPKNSKLNSQEAVLKENWNYNLESSKIYNLFLCLMYLADVIPGAKESITKLKQHCKSNPERMIEMGFPSIDINNLSMWQ